MPLATILKPARSRRVIRGELGDHVGAVPAGLHHGDDPGQLAVGAAEPVEHLTRGILIDLHQQSPLLFARLNIPAGYMSCGTLSCPDIGCSAKPAIAGRCKVGLDAWSGSRPALDCNFGDAGACVGWRHRAGGLP